MSALPGTGPVILALDTATERLCAALCDGRQGQPHLHTHDEAGGAAASARLLPVLQGLLARAGLPGSALDAVAFVQGPGAFTGLRTSCAVAQGLAWGWRKPVLPLDALMLLAEDLRGAPGGAGWAGGDEVAVAVDARMDEIYAARYAWRCGGSDGGIEGGIDGRRRIGVGGRDEGAVAGWQAIEPPALWAWPALAEAWAGIAPRALAGSALAVFGDRVAWPAAATRQATPHNRAAALGRLALQAWARGAAVPAAEALPLYLRDKVAQTTAERAAARGLA